MIVVLSGCCLVGAAVAATLGARHERHAAMLERVAGVLLIAGLAVAGWFLRVRL